MTWLRTKDAAAHVGITEHTFRKYVRDGILPEGRQVGAVMLWDRDELDAAIRGEASLPAVTADEAIERKKARQADARRRDSQGLRVSAGA